MKYTIEIDNHRGVGRVVARTNHFPTALKDAERESLRARAAYVYEGGECEPLATFVKGRRQVSAHKAVAEAEETAESIEHARHLAKTLEELLGRQRALVDRYRALVIEHMLEDAVSLVSDEENKRSRWARDYYCGEGE